MVFKYKKKGLKYFTILKATVTLLQHSIYPVDILYIIRVYNITRYIMLSINHAFTHSNHICRRKEGRVVTVPS